MTVKPAKATLGAQLDNLQGLTVNAADPSVLREAIELAFNYRGDVTLTLASGTSIEGYLFDRQNDKVSLELIVRMIPKDSNDHVTVRFADIASLHFTGKDTASGKTFENWIRKYAQKKLAGETAGIESEPLDEE